MNAFFAWYYTVLNFKEYGNKTNNIMNISSDRFVLWKQRHARNRDQHQRKVHLKLHFCSFLN